MKSVVLCGVFFFSFLSFSFGDYDDDEILIRLQPGVSIDTINARYGTITVEQEGPDTYEVRVPNPGDLEQIVAAMQNDPDIIWSEFNYFGETPEGSRRTLAVIDTDPTPSEYFDQLVLQRIKAIQAQAYSKGGGVYVAVIDTGVDYNHPDLTNHVLRDPVTNQVIGKDFVDGDLDPMDEANGIDEDNDGQIDEGAGHGTHVAGIISLVAPEAKIVPIRVLNSEGLGAVDDIAAAIRYFVQEVPGNKKVINLSLGIPNIEKVGIIHDAIENYIMIPGLPISIVASAGNDGLDQVHYPAREGDLLSIAATDPDDVKADFSNYDDVDVAAPGVGIYSTFLNGQYATWDGTSMAAPFVSGEVALLRSVERSTPKSVEEMETLIEQTSDNIDDLNPDVDVGSGRINLLKAIEKIAGLRVRKAVYITDRQKLVIHVESNAAPDDVLTVEGFGKMTWNPFKQRYILKVKRLAPMPATVTITSQVYSSSITVPVKAK